MRFRKKPAPLNLMQEERDELRAKLEATEKELHYFRVRVFGSNRAKSHDHTTACTIWGDDGQGGTKENYKEPLPCTCGALLNYEKHLQAQLQAPAALFPRMLDALRGAKLLPRPWITNAVGDNWHAVEYEQWENAAQKIEQAIAKAEVLERGTE